MARKAKRPKYRPARGFLLDEPVKRRTRKSAFLRRLERAQAGEGTADNVVPLRRRGEPK